jgi:hypothetical protein
MNVEPKEPDNNSKKGRPTLAFDQRLFEELCKIQCTKEEIANVMRLSPQTVLRRCKEIYGQSFEVVFARFSAHYIVSLRRAQLKLAQKNASMAIWLGKNYLGQSEKGYTDEELDRAIERQQKELIELGKRSCQCQSKGN